MSLMIIGKMNYLKYGKKSKEGYGCIHNFDSLPLFFPFFYYISEKYAGDET